MALATIVAVVMVVPSIPGASGQLTAGWNFSPYSGAVQGLFNITGVSGCSSVSFAGPGWSAHTGFGHFKVGSKVKQCTGVPYQSSLAYVDQNDSVSMNFTAPSLANYSFNAYVGAAWNSVLSYSYSGSCAFYPNNGWTTSLSYCQVYAEDWIMVTLTLIDPVTDTILGENSTGLGSNYTTYGIEQGCGGGTCVYSTVYGYPSSINWNGMASTVLNIASPTLSKGATYLVEVQVGVLAISEVLSYNSPGWTSASASAALNLKSHGLDWYLAAVDIY